jgi:hypothetical protein
LEKSQDLSRFSLLRSQENIYISILKDNMVKVYTKRLKAYDRLIRILERKRK